MASTKNNEEKYSPTTADLDNKSFGSLVPYAEPIWYSRNVSPHYTTSHRRLRDAVRKYVDDELLPHAFDWETVGLVPNHVSRNFTQIRIKNL